MDPIRRRTIPRLAGLAAGLAALPPARAQAPDDAIRRRLRESRPAEFPARPLELVVSYPAGGGMDIAARILAKHLERLIEAPVVVANRAGAGGLIGSQWLATQARPDGHTIAISSSNFWADALLRSEGRFGPMDLEPIAFINYDPVTWIVHTEGRFARASLQDVLAAARDAPGVVRLAASEATATGHLALMVESAAKVRFNKVQYQGGRQALTDLLGQHIEVSFGFYGEYRGSVEGGKVRAIAVAGSKRVALLKDVPTFNEVLGTQDIVWDAYRHVSIPRGVPADRKAWLEAAFTAALSNPTIAAEYADTGSTTDPTLNSARLVTEDAERRIAAQRAFYVRTGLLK